MMKNHTTKSPHLLKERKKKKIALTDSELFCKNYCTDALLELLHFSYREIIILKLRWNEVKAFEEIAYEICLSQERVRSIYRKNIQKIISIIKDAAKQQNQKIVVDTKKIALQIESEKEFKTKWVNILKEKHILTFQELANHNKEELLHIKSFGKNTIDSMEMILKQHGFEFAK